MSTFLESFLECRGGSYYEQAMTVETQEEADALFEKLVEEGMYISTATREQAEFIVRENLGALAVPHGAKTLARVLRLFKVVGR